MNALPSMRALLVILAGLASGGCGSPKEEAAAEPPAPQATTLATTTATASASASAAASLPPAPALPPVLEPVEKHKSKERYSGVFAVDGALVVASNHRVGKLTGAGIEWLGSIEKRDDIWGEETIDRVSGKLDALDVIFSQRDGRALNSGWAAINGNVAGRRVRNDFGILFFDGIAYVGDATFISGPAHDGRVFQVRGAPLDRAPMSPEDGGCTKAEVENNSPVRKDAALEPWVYGSTGAGTILAVGTLCRERGVHAEIWPKNGDKSKIVSVERFFKKEYLIELLPGPGDVAWIVDSELPCLVEFRDGEFSALPALPKRMVDATVSTDGVLHVTDGSTIYKYQGGAWNVVGSLAWSTDFATIAVGAGGIWATSGYSLYKLEPGKSMAYAEGCKTPFVHLFDVSAKTELGYTFPTTQKALATFADLEKITLVEYSEGRRRLGIKVPSKDLGESVIAHVKTTMKDEDPKLLCYDPKTSHAIKIAKPK